MSDEDWPIDNGLQTSRRKIYALIPVDWTFYGPILMKDQSWTVGVRQVNGSQSIETNRATLPAAFRALAEAIAESGLKRERSSLN
jgi:hypothetical protein